MRTAALALALALVLGLAASGCNAVFGLDPPGRGPDGGGGDDDDAGDAGDAGGDAAMPTLTGRVAVFQYDYVAPSGGVLNYLLDANFGPPGATCTERLRVGDCVSQTCMLTEPLDRPHAGRITFSGIVNGSFDPDGTGHYLSTSIPGRLYNGGTPVSVTASGGAVPAFVADFTAPGSVVFTSPMPVQSANPITIPRSVDLNFTWQPMAVGTVQINVGSSTPGLSIACLFPASAGMGKIAHEVLGDLPTGSAGMSSAVTTSVDVVAGDYTVTVRAAAVGKVNSGDFASGPILLQ